MEELSPKQRLWQACQKHVDRLLPLVRCRWLTLFVVTLIYVLRVTYIGGYHVISYCLAVFLLNQFLMFLTPMNANVDDEDEDDPILPVTTPGEYKPFIRKLGEFKLWRNSIIAVVLSLAASFSTSCDIPVFWPVLVVYFVVLFFATMRRQIDHMRKHRYCPFDIGKERYRTVRA